MTIPQLFFHSPFSLLAAATVVLVARLPRSLFPDDGVWHATTRGVERRRVFLSRGDGLRFLVHLNRAIERFDLRALAFCLMPNHYHLVVESEREALSRALHHVNGRHAVELNDRLGRSGHLWGDRFALWQVRDDEHLRDTCRYVVANPVRAGLCRTPSEWPWSGSRFGRD